MVMRSSLSCANVPVCSISMGSGTRTRTETGPFFLFVSHVYDFAVGEDAAGESRGLADPIKEFAGEYKEQMAEADRLAATWRCSRQSGGLPPLLVRRFTTRQIQANWGINSACQRN